MDLAVEHSQDSGVKLRSILTAEPFKHIEQAEEVVDTAQCRVLVFPVRAHAQLITGQDLLRTVQQCPAVLESLLTVRRRVPVAHVQGREQQLGSRDEELSGMYGEMDGKKTSEWRT